MPAHHDFEPGHGGVDIQFVDVMQHVDLHAGHLGYRRKRQRGGPRTLVDIASHGRYRRDGTQFVQDPGFAGVPGVNDPIRPSKGLQSLFPHPSVGVRDQSEGNQIAISSFTLHPVEW